jgi:hypothetical protein
LYGALNKGRLRALRNVPRPHDGKVATGVVIPHSLYTHSLPLIEGTSRVFFASTKAKAKGAFSVLKIQRERKAQHFGIVSSLKNYLK